MRRSWRAPIRGRGVRALPGALSPGLLLLVVLAAPTAAQEGGERAFLRSAAIHFDSDPGEVSMLAEWAGAAEEVPVALHLARHAGVSAEAILAFRRGGRSWADLLVRYGLHAGHLHIPLVTPPGDGPLGAAYAAYAERSPESWRIIRLPDESVVALVNLLFLSEHLELPAEEVASALTRYGSAVAAHGSLRGRGGDEGRPPA